MYAHSTLAAQIMLGSGDGHSHLLMLLVTGRDDVLQILPATVAGGSHHLQKGIKIALAQGSHLLGHTVVIGVEVEGAQHSAVAALLAAGRNICKEGLKGHVPQHLAAAHSGHSAALVGDGGVLVGQVGVVCTGVQNAQRQTGLGKVHLHRLHVGVCLVGKVDGDNVAHAGGHLIHQTTGLAKVHIFSPLADLCNGNGGDFFIHEAVVQNHTDQHLKCGRGRNAAALGHIGGNVHVQTGQLCAALTESLALAAQQGSSGVLLLLAGGQVIKVDDAQVVALALHAQLVQAVGGGSSDHINVHTACQHAAMLVVGVVAADLGAAGGTIQTGLGVCAKGGL